MENRARKICLAGMLLLSSLPALGQTLAVDMGIDLANPEFLREFNGSFEVGLTAGAPAMNPRESVLLSVVSDMYRDDLAGAVSFVLEEIRAEERRLRDDQRRQGSPAMDYVYSANVEFALGQLYQLQRNRNMAIQYYLQAIEKYPSYVAAYVRLMEIYLTQEDCENALVAGKQALDIGGVNGNVFRGLGVCYYLQEDFGAALAAFRIAKAFLPQETSVFYYHALSAMNTGNYDEAISVLAELIRDYPDRSSYYFLQVNAYLESGAADRALQTLEIARRQGMLNNEGLALLGNIYINKEMPEAAQQAYISAMSLDQIPQFDVVRSQFTNLSRFNDWQLTEEFLSAASGAYAGRLTGANAVVLEVMQAQVLIGLGQATEGARLLLEVLESNPTNGDALLFMARYYRLQQDFERADIFFQRAAKEEAVALQALMENAQLASDRADWLLAIDLLREARELAPMVSVSIIDQNLAALERMAELSAF